MAGMGPGLPGDASRLACTELLPDEKKQSAIAFLDRALDWFGRLGVAVERVMTDNGSAYRSHAFRERLAALGLRHIRPHSALGGLPPASRLNNVLGFDS